MKHRRKLPSHSYCTCPNPQLLNKDFETDGNAKDESLTLTQQLFQRATAAIAITFPPTNQLRVKQKKSLDGDLHGKRADYGRSRISYPGC